MLQSSKIRFAIDPRDVPPAKAARRLHLTEAEFTKQLPALLARGFPSADETTGMYDLKAIDSWMDSRREARSLTTASHLLDARSSRSDRLARLAAAK
jgi:hypothetical protein